MIVADERDSFDCCIGGTMCSDIEDNGPGTGAATGTATEDISVEHTV